MFEGLKKLGRNRPICFFDLETTSAEVKSARIVEISIIKLDLDFNESTYDSLIDPGVRIPKEASEVHGIYDDTVKGSPKFRDVAKDIHNYIKNSILIGFNSNKFDIPILHEEFYRAGIDWDYTKEIFVDVRNIYVRNEGRTLKDAYKLYLNKELEDAHQASADTRATLEILDAQLQRYTDLPQSFKELESYSNYDKERIDLTGKFIRGSDGDLYYDFGKNKGMKAKFDRSYLTWIATASDFSSDVKSIARKLLEGKDV